MEGRPLPCQKITIQVVRLVKTNSPNGIGFGLQLLGGPNANREHERQKKYKQFHKVILRLLIDCRSSLASIHQK